MTGNAHAVVIEAPQKIEEYIYKKDEENHLLKPPDKILAVDAAGVNDFPQLKGPEQHDQDQKSIKKVANAEGDPSK